MKLEYAAVSWCAEDVQELRPSWSLERCEEELATYERSLQALMIERGWQVLECLLPAEEGESETGERRASRR